MPFSDRDAYRHTHKAATASLKRLWAKVANYELPRLGDKRAIMAANKVVAKASKRPRRKRRII